MPLAIHVFEQSVCELLQHTYVYRLLLPSPSCRLGTSQPAAVAAGFDVADAIALLRLDDLYVEVFEVKDVKVQFKSLMLVPCTLDLKLS